MRTLMFLALAAALAWSVRATAADAKGDASKGGSLVGSWTVASGEEDGKPSPEEKIKGSMMTVDKGSITLTDKSNKQLWVLDYKVDETKTPKQITMTVKSGQGAGQSSEGIYEIDGDTLKLCYGLPGADRPKGFKTREGSKENCFVLKRADAKDNK